MLCDICNSLNVDELIPTAETLHKGVFSGTDQHASYADLKSAAEAGCGLCRLIVRMSQEFVKQEEKLRRLSKHPVQFKMRLQGHESPQYQGGCILLIFCSGLMIAQFEVYVPRESELARPGRKLISGRPICSDPASDECFSITKEWILQCWNSEDHEICRAIGQETDNAALLERSVQLPTRLIDVGSPDGNQDPKLVLSAGLPKWQSRRYACLSHRWTAPVFRRIVALGSSYDASPQGKLTSTSVSTGPLTTLLENYHQRLKGIPMEDLPRTFRDAVFITRKLGLRYVWIDSLCIIQDSKTDWGHESTLMADIYMNSYITIAAESSRDSSHGILKTRLLDFGSIRVPYRSTAHNIQSVMYLRPAQDDWEACITSKHDNGTGSTLSTRAWVLQESMLAPRTIHYGHQQLFWECRSASHAEGNINPIAPSKRAREWSWLRSKCFLHDLPLGGGDISTEINGTMSINNILYLRWYTILEDYSSRDITFPSDIFPALIGLATHFRLRLQDQYIAGLWRADLLRGLLWSVVEPEPCVTATPYRAPSWSWASVVGQIHSPQRQGCIHMAGSYRAEILHVDVTPEISASSTNAIHGAISAARLHLRGRWIDTTQWPTFQDEPWSSGFLPVLTPKGGSLFRYLDCGKEEVVAQRLEKKRTLCLLQMSAFVEHREHIGGQNNVYCMILESGDEGDRSAYRRVGMAMLVLCSQEWLDSWEVRSVLVV